MITTVEMPITPLRLPWRYRLAFWVEDRWHRIRWGRERYDLYVRILKECEDDLNKRALGEI